MLALIIQTTGYSSAKDRANILIFASALLIWMLKIYMKIKASYAQALITYELLMKYEKQPSHIEINLTTMI